MGVCGNISETNRNLQFNYILQRLVPLRHKVYVLNSKTRDSCINLYIYLKYPRGLFQAQSCSLQLLVNWYIDIPVLVLRPSRWSPHGHPLGQPPATVQP